MPSKSLLNSVRKIIGQGEWANYHHCIPKLGPMTAVRGATPGTSDDRWRVYCGDGRYDETKRNALFAKRSGVGVNFRLVGTTQAGLESYEICVVWPDGWRLMFHQDPARATWPSHPEHHLQFQGPSGERGMPSFHDWRPPFGDTCPKRLLEYIVAQIR